MYFITTKRMLEVCFSAHPNIQYRTFFNKLIENGQFKDNRGTIESPLFVFAYYSVLNLRE